MLTTKKKLEILCEINNTTLAALAREIGISKSAINRYDESVPSGEVLLRLAQYFNVTPKSLIDKSDGVEIVPESENMTDMQEIVDLLVILKLSKVGYAVAKDMLISIKKNVDRKNLDEL